jgi:hypothetical protein
LVPSRSGAMISTIRDTCREAIRPPGDPDIEYSTKPFAVWRRHIGVLTSHPQPMRLILGAGVALLAVLTASGCSGGSTKDVSSVHALGGGNAATPGGNGSVSGVVRGYGGPLVPTPTPHSAMNGAGLSGQKVVISDASGVAASGSSGPRGRFVMLLPPGHYQIKAGCSQAKPVTVTTGVIVSVTLQCDFP